MAEDARERKPSQQANHQKRRMRIRWNVIYLISLGYGAVGVVFAVLMARDMPPADAYDIVQGPLMALIGGTVALAKDLAQLDKEELSSPE